MINVRVKKLYRSVNAFGILTLALSGQAFVDQPASDDYFPVQLYLSDQEHPYLLVLPYNSLIKVGIKAFCQGSNLIRCLYNKLYYRRSLRNTIKEY